MFRTVARKVGHCGAQVQIQIRAKHSKRTLLRQIKPRPKLGDVEVRPLQFPVDEWAAKKVSKYRTSIFSNILAVDFDVTTAALRFSRVNSLFCLIPSFRCYFRHAWDLTFSSTPGRVAVCNHPHCRGTTVASLHRLQARGITSGHASSKVRR